MGEGEKENGMKNDIKVNCGTRTASESRCGRW